MGSVSKETLLSADEKITVLITQALEGQIDSLSDEEMDITCPDDMDEAMVMIILLKDLVEAFVKTTAALLGSEPTEFWSSYCTTKAAHAANES